MSKSRSNEISPLLMESTASSAPSSSSPSVPSFVGRRAKSVGSVVVGIVGRTQPKLTHTNEEEEDENIQEDEEEEEDNEDDHEDHKSNGVSESRGNPTEGDGTDLDKLVPPAYLSTLPRHAASRTHCAICTNAFDLSRHLPILLHAGHNFCAACFATSELLHPIGSTIECPACKLAVRIPIDDMGAKQASIGEFIHAHQTAPLDQDAPSNEMIQGPAASFPINYRLRDELELSQFAQQVEAANVVCHKCDDAASGICLHCEVYLCPFHEEDHRKSKDTKTHPLASLHDFLSTHPLSLHSKSFCSHHTDTELDLFCLQCQVPICVRCSLPSGGTIHCSPNGHQHPVEPLKIEAMKQYADLSLANESSKAKYAALIKGMVEIQKVAVNISTREEKVHDTIVRTFDRIHQQVEERKEALLAKLSELVASKNYTLNMQTQYLYILARAMEDATAEIESMIETFHATGINAHAQSTYAPTSNAATPAAPSSPTNSAMNSKTTPKRPNSTHSNVHTPTSAPSAVPTSSAPFHSTLARSISSASKLVCVSPHLLANMDALLRFQPVSMHPEESDQFGFYVANTPTTMSRTHANKRGKLDINTTDNEEDIQTDDRLTSMLSKIGSLGDSMAIASLCTADGDGLHTAHVRVESRFQIEARDRFGQLKQRGGDPFVVEFIGPKGSASGRVTDHQNGRYTVRYMVLSPGHYSVVVSIHGRHIAGSPFHVRVQSARESANVIGRDWMATIGTRGSGGHQLLNPMGLTALTATDGNGALENRLYVTDYGNHRLSVWRVSLNSSQPTFHRTIGRAGGGSDNGALRHPWSIAVDPLTNHLLVADSGNHRVQVLTSEGEWVQSFGAVGSQPGKFRHPAGIAIYTPPGIMKAASSSAALNDHNSNESHPTNGDNPSSSLVPSVDDTVAASSSHVSSTSTFSSSSLLSSSTPTGQLIFVSDREKHRIQVFDSTGRYIRMFGSSGSGPAQFLHPSGIAIHPQSEQLYVTDFSNHRIQVFTLSGQFVHMFGSRGTMYGQFIEPVGVSVDREGCVYVADQGNNRIQVFNSSGTFLRLLGSSAPAGIRDRNAFTKPSALAIASINMEGHIIHAPPTQSQQEDSHAEESSKSTTNQFDQDETNPSQQPTNPANSIANTFVFVSDSANHRVQIFTSS